MSMHLDKSSSSIVLDVAWNEVDKKNQGFIYAKNFPALIKSIETILSHGEEDSSQLSLLSNTGVDVIDTFAKEKEFFKIYKDEFKEIFQGLVGKSFKDAIEGTMISKKKILASVEYNENEEGSPEKSRQDSPGRLSHRLRILETKLKTTNEELRFKDGIIAEKDRELISLTRSVGEYKDKYEFLQRQFSFYKGHGEAINDGDNNKGEQDAKLEDNERYSSTRHEFIISELKRKLQEQTVLITTLRDQIQIGGVELGSTNGKSSKRGGFTVGILKNFDIFSTTNLLLLFFLMTFTVLSFIFFFIRNWLQTNNAEFQSQKDLSWWENISLLSRIGWFFMDWTEPIIESENQIRNDEALAAYDRIFGLGGSEQ